MCNDLSACGCQFTNCISEAMDKDSIEETQDLKQQSTEMSANTKLPHNSFGLGTNGKVKETMIVIYMLIVIFVGLSMDLLPMGFLNQEAKLRGLVEYQTGIVLGCYDLARFLFAMCCSLVVKRISAKIAFMLGSVLVGSSCMAFGFVGYSSSPTMMLYMSIIMRLICGAGTALLCVSGTSIMMKSKFYTNATIFSWIEMAHGLAVMMSVTIGGSLYEWLGYIPTFVIVGGLGIVISLPAIVLVPNLDEVEDNEKKGFVDLMRIPSMFVFFLALVVVQFACKGQASMQSEWVAETFQISIAMWSLTYGPGTVLYILFTFLASMVTNKGYIYSPLIISWTTMILSLLLMCPAPFLLPLFMLKRYISVAVICNAIFGGSLAFVYVSLFGAVLSFARHNGHESDSLHTYTRISSMFTSGWAFGSMLGPPTSGWIVQKLSYPWSVSIMAFINISVLIMLILMLLIMRLRRSLPHHVTQKKDDLAADSNREQEPLIKQDIK